MDREEVWDTFKIIISPKKVVFKLGIPTLQITTAGKVSFLLSYNNWEYHFIGDTDLSWIQSMEVYWPLWYSRITRNHYRMFLPDDFRENLLIFLRSSHELKQQNLDCLDFFLFLSWFHNWYQKKELKFLFENFQFLPIHSPKGDEPIGTWFLISELSPKGELFSNEDYHVVISIWKDQYLSKLGSDGPIVVTNWKEMLRLYPFRTITRISRSHW